MKRIFFSNLVCCLLFASAATKADIDDPPLYVGQNGTDSGDCEDEASPCRTIHYALQRVGKNGQIRVGGGSFEIENTADVVYLLSGAIDVRGSNSSGDKSTLTGVPHELSTELAAKGFRVIADSKNTHQAAVAAREILRSNSAAESCNAGFAGIFPCNDVDLLAHISDRTPGARGADIWGFMDLNTHREYAIVGYSTGVAVYDVTQADGPREVGFIDGQRTTWRDIKVYQFWNELQNRWNAYAYVTADNASDGLFIVDLSELPQRIARSSYASDFAEAHNIYLTDTDFSTGLSISGDSPLIILAGSDLSDGRFRSYSLEDPGSPTFVNMPATPAGQPGGDRLYMHDAASMLVTDDRKNTQCLNAMTADHCDILFDFNESTFDIWDISDATEPQRLSQTPYANADYVHSGWWSEDKLTLYVQDETDERDRGLSTTLRAFSIADLTAPVLQGIWTGPTAAIDHNGFVRGNRYYMSNYSRGLSILDITDTSNPVLVGRFDTYPSSDDVGFPGNWGTYPFLPSGNIALSDIDSGFYMVADRTLDVEAGSLSFTTAAYGGEEGETLSLHVSRSGSEGTVSVAWELIGATAGFEDVVQNRGVLAWADGDGSDKALTLDLINDGEQEALERVLVRLSAPEGGATLSSPSMASAYISDPGEATSIAFAVDSISLTERGFGTAVAVVKRSGSAVGSASVEFSLAGGNAGNGSDFSGTASGVLSWEDGDADPKWIEYVIADDGLSEDDEQFSVSLSNPTGAAIGTTDTLQVTILDGSGPNSSPNSIAGPSQVATAGSRVTLDGSGSNDPDGDSLDFAWSQTTGQTVALTDADTATASFTAPNTSSDMILRFQLDVTDPGGLADSSDVTITVTAPSSNQSDGGGGPISPWMLLGLIGFLFIRKDAS